MIFNLTGGGGIRKPQFSYTGNYLESAYQGTDGVSYKLYTLTSSGVLTAKMQNADIWLCGGGSSGAPNDTSGTMPSSRGGAGAYCASAMQQTLSGNYTVTIGAGNGGTTSVGELLSAAGVTSAGNGGTGGGNGGTGDGQSKYPFGDTAQFQCHCAGGGGGARANNGPNYWTTYNGGTGGTNGGNGGNISLNSSETFQSTASGGAGGNYGGGKGGNVSGTTVNAGASATFYGSGGGLGAYSSSNFQTYNGGDGAGYQGVCYIRVPA